MKITVIAVGKIKDRWIKDGIDEYTKRLKRFAKLEIIEIPDEKVPDSFSEKDVLRAIDREGERILSRWPSGAWAMAMSPTGKQLGSKGLADLLGKQTVSGTNHFLYIIGGSNGLSEQILKKANQKLSFGSHTFPHQLFRVMLLEQVYRAEKIRAGETYHK